MTYGIEGRARSLVIGCAVAVVVALSAKPGAAPRAAVAPNPCSPVTSPAAAGPPRQAPVSLVRQEVGLASWYGEELQGSATTSGEPFDMNALTAAHRRLPLGTRITVTNLTNHRSVVLRVNDRGPNVAGRLLDVSKAAAERLGFRGAGIAKVRVIPLSYPRWYLARRNDSGASRPVLCAENR